MDEISWPKESRAVIPRLLFLELCRMYLSRKTTLAEIGRTVGDITASAFSRNTARLAEKIEKDPLYDSVFRNANVGRYILRNS